MGFLPISCRDLHALSPHMLSCDAVSYAVSKAVSRLISGRQTAVRGGPETAFETAFETAQLSLFC